MQAEAPVLTEFVREMDYTGLTECIRCGFCLPACPTYRHLEVEHASPRGRLALMRGLVEGRPVPLPEVVERLDLCLGCRACEPVCPSGVKYGRRLEEARAALARRAPLLALVALARRAALGWIIPSRLALRILAALLLASRRTGVVAALRGALPFHLGDLEPALPDPPIPWRRGLRGRISPAGERRGRAALFRGCVADAILPETNRRTAALLALAGYDVVVPAGQTCCGALHAHTGELAMARDLARRNIAAFEASGAELYVNNAGGCGAHLGEYGHLFHGEAGWEERARAFAGRVRDVTELLATFPLPRPGPLAGRVTYQDSCHLLNGQGVKAQPRALLKAIPGLEYVELPEADRCCGSGGVYNLTQYATSMRILDEKMDRVQATGAAIVATANPGCLFQMRLGIHRAGLADRVRVAHVVDLLAEAHGLA